MGVVRKSNSYQRIAEATRRQPQQNGEARLLTLVAACLVVFVASWFAMDHSTVSRPDAPREVAGRIALP